MRGCPFDMAEEDFETAMAVIRSLWWVDQGVPPEGGGLNQQAATYVEAAEVLAHLRQDLTKAK